MACLIRECSTTWIILQVHQTLQIGHFKEWWQFKRRRRMSQLLVEYVYTNYFGTKCTTAYYQFDLGVLSGVLQPPKGRRAAYELLVLQPHLAFQQCHEGYKARIGSKVQLETNALPFDLCVHYKVAFTYRHEHYVQSVKIIECTQNQFKMQIIQEGRP